MNPSEVHNMDQNRPGTEPTKVWESVLGQLRLDMAKAPFDTWVRDTKAASFEDGTFTITASNAYAKEWLESRLTSTVTGLLAGIMERTVVVRFVVQQAPPQEQIDKTRDMKDIPVSLGLNYSSVYNQIVQPNRVMIAPAYMFRHIHHLGPTAGMILLAFYQLVYLCHIGDGGGPRQTSYTIETAAATIARWAGISKATFWREFSRNQYLAHFVKATQQYNPETSGQEENLWTVQVEMPLTPEDHQALHAWLKANNITQTPIEALNKALKTKRDLIIPDNWREYQNGETLTPATVTQVVQSLINDRALTTTEQQVVEVLIQSLREHLQKKEGRKNDLIITTWYFMREVVPLIGCGPAWAILYLRDNTFGVLRKSVAIPGGWKEIAARIGISSPNTVAKWFKLPVIGTELFKKYTDRNEINWKILYAKAIKEEKQPTQDVAVTFEVQPFEFVSLKHLGELLAESDQHAFAITHQTSLDTQIDATRSRGRRRTEKKRYLSEGIVKYDPQIQKFLFHQIDSRRGKLDFETGVSIRELDSEMGLLIGNLDSKTGSLLGELDFATGTLLPNLESTTGSELVIETLLNTIFKLLSGNLISIEEENFLDSESPQSESIAAGGNKLPRFSEINTDGRIPSKWDLATLCELESVSPVSIAEMNANGVTAKDWVACLLFYNSNEQNLNAPFRMAIKHLTQNLPEVGKDYKQLSDLDPERLIRLILHQLEPSVYPAIGEIPLAWKRTMAKTSRKKLQRLLKSLIDFVF
jgi:hypothetical protein